MQRLVSPRFGQNQKLNPVGEMEAPPVYLTGVEWDKAGGTYLFGSEIKAQHNQTLRPFPRQTSGHWADNAFMRSELDFISAELKAKGLSNGATVVWVQLPGGFRSVFRAKVQSCGASGDVDQFPAYDDPNPTVSNAKDNPLGLQADLTMKREQQSDLNALLEIHAAERDIYLNKTNMMRASFAVNRVVSCFFPHRIQPRWRAIRTPPNRGGGVRSRYGIVQDIDHAIEVVRSELTYIIDLRRNAIRNGDAFKTFGDNRIKLSRDLEDYLDDIVDISILQALGGLSGDKSDPFLGQPVSKLAARYMDDHLLSINKSTVDTQPLEGVQDEAQSTDISALSPEEFLQMRDELSDQLERLDLMIKTHRPGNRFTLKDLIKARGYVEDEISRFSR